LNDNIFDPEVLAALPDQEQIDIYNTLHTVFFEILIFKIIYDKDI